MDWQGLMRVGLHHLRLKPSEFWALAPFELEVMLGTAGALRPMQRSQFDALLRDFPDLKKEQANG